MRQTIGLGFIGISLPWPLTYDLDHQTRPRCHQGQSLYQISWPYVELSGLESANRQTGRQTDTHTHTDGTVSITFNADAGGKKGNEIDKKQCHSYESLNYSCLIPCVCSCQAIHSSRTGTDPSTSRFSGYTDAVLHSSHFYAWQSLEECSHSAK